MKKSFVCYSLKMARFLAERGCHLNGTAINTNRPWLNVYYFNNNERLRLAVLAFYEQNQKN